MKLAMIIFYIIIIKTCFTQFKFLVDFRDLRILQAGVHLVDVIHQVLFRY